MDPQRAADELRTIRELMERPIRYSTMSGLSAILAGLAATAGVLTDSAISANFSRETAFLANSLVWLGVFLTALVSSIVLTQIRGRRQGLPAWSSVKRRILLTILPPFVAGVGLTCAIGYRWSGHIGPNQWGLIPAIWMAFYGVALWQVGEFSTAALRAMGAAFVLAALPTAAFWQTWPYVPLGVTFGGFHIVYGLYTWRRYGG
jgi:hypothetical protein